ncbi:Hypothetical protein SRAE_1000235200 [Strongyloides ratti]|uniref:Uncharacterized protein n=1 Tax=Strongyloides ratti TaxID=34506 RepID=A0A090L2Q1_STRRB|nr:Hypothetical protein SRAE_1000235200 [Strongyloides ratti]CEF64096.1 Hypothetical protein SRAE_1000235200 [Strongyloides ratti]
MNCLLLAKRESTYINIRRCIHKYQGTGIQRYDKFLEAKEIAKANEGKVEDPLEYTILGNKKKSKKDIFFYSDRISGKGYSHYSSTIYMNRPYEFFYQIYFIKLKFLLLYLNKHMYFQKVHQYNKQNYCSSSLHDITLCS